MVEADYNRVCSLTILNHEKKDLERQYKVISTIIKKITDEYVNSEKIPFDYIQNMVEIFKHSVYHITQNGSYDIDSIQSLFRNSVTYDKVIKCYYGIVKNILEFVYSFGKPDQSELVPFITFEAHPLVHSSLIASYNHESEKILAISLPYDAYHNIYIYFPLMYHEIGHYVSPHDRIKRNGYAFAVICLMIIPKFYNNIDVSDNKRLSEIIRKNLILYIDMYNKSENILALFENNWAAFCKMTKQAFDSVIIADYNSSNNHKAINSMCEMLKCIISKTIEDFRKEFPQCEVCDDFYNKSTTWLEIDGVLDGIREATADMFMKQYTRITAAEYIALIIFSRYRKSIKVDNQILSCVRLSVMLKAYGIEEDNLDNIFESVKSIAEKIMPEIKDVYHVTFGQLKDSYTYFNNKYYDLYDLLNEMAISVVFKENDTVNLEKWKIQNNIYNTRSTNDNTQNIECFLQLINLSYFQQSLYDIKNNSDNTGEPIQDWDYMNDNIITKINIYVPEKEIVNNIIEYKIDTVDNFTTALNRIYDCLTDNGEKLWFRGHRDESWKLDCSLFRKKGINHYNFLIDAYNEFVAYSSNSLELKGNLSTDADWISYMQHYFIPTHFQDWSEQPLASLFFALDNYFESKCPFFEADYTLRNCKSVDNQGNLLNKTYGNDAVVWVLNPYRMNKILYKDNGIDIGQSILPNVSIKQNTEKEEISRFLFNKPDVFPKIEELLNDDKKRDEFLIKHKPMAISTNILSNRIEHQKGHFVAFDIKVESFLNEALSQYTTDDLNMPNKKTEYKIISEMKKTISSLEDYNSFYIHYTKNNNNNNNLIKPYIAKIIIPECLKEKMAKYVKRMNISLSHIYPELQNIGKDITKASEYNQKFI